MNRIRLSVPEQASEYEIVVGHGLLSSVGATFADIFPSAERTVIVSNEKVFGLYGSAVTDSLEAAGVRSERFLMSDGERFKSLETARELLASLSSARLSRSDAVVALGGGVVGDLAGFVASIYLRGIPFIQVPTTLLAMIDSSVGGKTGVNTEFGKNLVGSFHDPAAVIADVDTLCTLETRELSAGFYEVVKQCALAGTKKLEEIGEFLADHPPSRISEAPFSDEVRTKVASLVSGQVEFKARVVAADAREEVGRSDGMSRKILNFGHTTAHALEKVTDFRYLRHGEAVGYGMLAAANISKMLELCPRDSIRLLNDVVRRVGILPPTDGIAVQDVLDAIAFDKKARGGSVEWILLEDIGNPVILPGPEIPPHVIRESIEHAISH